MKRSEINGIQESAKAFFAEHKFVLPPWAAWRPKDWQGRGDEIAEIRENMLGWDVTDFGSGDFAKRGLFLFTLRNGNPARDKKPYAEKIMIVQEGQETPTHFHRIKMEDIINRGGGVLVMELYASDRDENLSKKPLEVSVDGIRRKIAAGEKVVLSPGESICLEPYVYHRFWAEKGRTLVGEVSVINDDRTDNRFHEKVGRFPQIDEDVEALHLLASDYGTYFGGRR
jgi:D-lyxose ketol-isomerase